MNDAFDNIIIGAGQAGFPLAMRLAGAGQSVAIIERRHLGGSCVNFGCTPSKAMVASARAAWAARRAHELGVVVDGEVRADMRLVRAHADRLVQQSREGLRDALGEQQHITIIEGHARFTAPHRLDVDGRTLSAPRIFIDTGSRAALPPIPGLADSDYWTPTSATDPDELPEHLVVLGGGPVGVELAQLFRRLGSRVTIIEGHGRLLPDEDTDVSAAVQQWFEEDGIDVLVGARAQRIESGGGRLRVDVDAGGDMKAVEGSRLLLAAGRQPNTDDLALDAAGIEPDERGYIPVDDRLRTAADGVWALGEINGHGAFTHTAYQDYQIVVDHLLGDGNRSLDQRIPVHSVYIDPPLGRVGLDETRARNTGERILLAKMPMSAVARARERAETRGFMKVLVDGASERILGATVLGIAGDEVVHVFLALMAADAPYAVLRDLMGIHPTVGELLPSLAQALEPIEPAIDKAGTGSGGAND